MYFIPALEIALLAILAGLYVWVSWQLHKLSREQETLMHRARKRAWRTVEDARDQAVRIVGEAKMEVEKDLQQTSTAQLVEYKKTLQDVSQSLQTSAAEETSKFVAATRQKTESDLAKYKQDKIKAMDAEFKAVLQQTAKKVLGKTLNLADHTELIIAALEEAKKNHVFNLD